MELPKLVQDLALILGAAGVASLICQKLKQPILLGYLIVGFIVGPYTPPFSLVVDIPSIQIWSHLGVIFIMFSLGLDFRFHRLKSVAGSATLATALETTVMIALGAGAGLLFGLSQTQSLILGTTLAISSTTVIVRNIQEQNLKNDPSTPYIVGILIIEDIIGALILTLLPSLLGPQSSQPSVEGPQTLMINLVLFVLGVFICFSFVPKIINFLERIVSDETLTLILPGFCLAFVIFAEHLNYSAPLGAFLSGSILAECKSIKRMESLMIPIKDIFAAVFFVSIGMLINPAQLKNNGLLIVVLILLTIFGKIFATYVGLKIGGISSKIARNVSSAMAQIGEFSFIIASLGLTMGLIKDYMYSVIVVVSVITTFMSPYLMKFSYSNP